MASLPEAGPAVLSFERQHGKINRHLLREPLGHAAPRPRGQTALGPGPSYLLGPTSPANVDRIPFLFHGCTSMTLTGKSNGPSDCLCTSLVHVVVVATLSFVNISPDESQ
ncbi:unnamed protein product [Pleuronectes platessa]|uniref:Uncharacterized protein n=1 Tax=Pleuronectes platessa TaxID=8262 RepID=A0A9N7V5B7_PLEPL|nr:unnamed protein product [Pleuronectes platessa]